MADDNRRGDLNWQRRIADKPRCSTGACLLLGVFRSTPETCRNTYFEVDYADFVAWIDIGYPDPSIAQRFRHGRAARLRRRLHLRRHDGGTRPMRAGSISRRNTPDLSDLRTTAVSISRPA